MVLKKLVEVKTSSASLNDSWVRLGVRENLWIYVTNRYALHVDDALCLLHNKPIHISYKLDY